MYDRVNRIIGGFICIGIGIGYLGAYLNWWIFTIFFPGWWGIGLLLLAMSRVVKHGIGVMNVIVGCIGLYGFLQANQMIMFQISFPIILAVGCIYIGIRIIFTRRIKWHEYRASGFKD